MRYVFYHGQCMDGFGAAWAAWTVLGDSAKYIPVAYGKTSILDTEFNPEDIVYIVDYSINNEEFEELVDRVAKVVMLDHHRTALDRFTGLEPYPGDFFEVASEKSYVLFDMNKSGALLTWEHFHPDELDEKVPPLIKHISDRDLWKFQYNGTKEIHALLTSKPFDFKVWTGINARLTVGYGPIDQGEMLLEMQEQIVANICKKAYMTIVAGYVVPAVNASSHWSEVGNKLLDLYPQAPFALSYCDQPDGTRMMSLRSRQNEDVDVAHIAGLFGGGGHKNAAGFRLNVNLNREDLAEPPRRF